ncbi:hypothetical protein SKAU_G00230780 [Synaphobranchus kaupii]|uniref:Uncharacterized protein n=1 Tax=Synaphobranchus kaupii TaxID=118154 RepID=A0A9Q1F5I9_SYNKA|nr:hypothetical protein SKAU_G00230780 [Synaphobranchus kaupii]
MASCSELDPVALFLFGCSGLRRRPAGRAEEPAGLKPHLKRTHFPTARRRPPPAKRHNFRLRKLATFPMTERLFNS